MSLICGKCGSGTMARGCDTAPGRWMAGSRTQARGCGNTTAFGRSQRRSGPEWRLPVAIPDFQSLMLPVLELAADGKEHTLAEAREVVAQRFGLTDAERAELLPSGRQRR